MGKKIFGIYLAKLDAPNSEAHARLELPASPLELHDAMDKVQLQENEELYLEIDDYSGILVSKYLYHDDVRNHGSGAAGMTNMLRTFGKKAAALTAAGDVLKGVAAVCIGRWLFGFLPADAAVSPYLGVYLTAILAVVGHTKPIKL